MLALCKKTPPPPMNITYFRTPRQGPEIELEAAIVSYGNSLVRAPKSWLWTAGSLPLGAGMPDLILVAANRRIRALPLGDTKDAEIFAYLRVIPRARVDTIAERLGQKPTHVENRLEELQRAGALRVKGRAFSLASGWRNILPQIVSVEAKISNWQKALKQAARNRIFSHKSFVAFPDGLAARVSEKAEFRKLGVGILGVSNNGKVSVFTEAATTSPRVWIYYYRLALMASKHIGAVE